MAYDSNTSRAKYGAAQEMAYGDITDAMTPIGDPFMVSPTIVYMQNFTDVIIDFSISYDGSDITFSLASGGIIATDLNTNGMAISVGESAFCQYRDSAPTKGFVQLSYVAPA